MNKEVNQKYKLYTESFEEWLDEETKKKEGVISPLKIEISHLRRKGKIIVLNIGLKGILKIKTGEKYLVNLRKIKNEYISLTTFGDSDLKKMTFAELVYKDKYINVNHGTIKSNLEMIGAELSEKIQEQIFKQLNYVIYDRTKKINSHVDNIKKILKKLRLSEETVFKVGVGRKNLLPLGTSSSVISNVAFFRNQTLDGTVNLNFKDNKLQLDFNRVIGIYGVNIDNLFNNLRLNIGSLDKNTQYVVKNYKTLKEQYIEYKKLEVLQNRTNDIIEYIEKDASFKINFKELIDTLKKVSLEFKEKSDKLGKILRECEFEKTVKNVYHEQKQLADKKAQAEFLISRYVELSQQYRQAFNNNETEKAFKIKQEMDEIYEKASPEDRKKMTTNAQFQKYVSEDKETEVEREQTPMERLMELASYELKQNPPIDHVEEVFNGDVRTHYFDNSDAKINMVKEWQKISKMSPVQRGLYLNGKISFKSEDDLTPDEIAYYNTYYSDSALPYVKDCKALEKQEENQKKVNSIYRDYIRAKVSGYKKSFGSYVQEKAQVIGLNPEELTDKMIKDAVEIGEGRNR